MGVRTTIIGITPLTAERAAAAAAGQDIDGMLTIVANKCAEATIAINAVLDFMPSGSNATTLGAEVTALS